MIDAREQTIQNWLKDIVKQASIELQPLTGDASLRRYYRASTAADVYIVMDSQRDPSIERFIAIQKILATHQTHVPQVIAYEHTEKLLLLEDFGDDLFLSQLNETSADELYLSAIDNLIHMQKISPSLLTCLPQFDTVFLEEQWTLFLHWFLSQHLQLRLTETEQATLMFVQEKLKNTILTLPMCFVHLDYHSRNLMCLPNQQIGILDFQDARLGPAIYDVVSLLQDAYIQWPTHKVNEWQQKYFIKAKDAGIALPENFNLFQQQFHCLALQRHLKNLGIFARLHYRDHKPGYLQNIPMLIHYITEIIAHNDTFITLDHFFRNKILPLINTKATSTKVS